MPKDRQYQKLSSTELEPALKELPDWSVKAGKLHGEFKFKSFRPAFGFMTQVALKAEKMDHHPDWSNSYNQVTINLFTHQTESITDYDLKLAAAISEIYDHYR